MHEDLRRRALESGKTVSRKARSRQSSAPGSRGNSASNSRANSRSRQNSDDEEGDFSDTTQWSTASLDGVFSGDDETSGSVSVTWEDELATRIEAILNRKRSSVHGREEDLTSYVHILRARFAYEQITSKFDELISAFLRSVRAETSERETLTALRAIQISAVSDPREDVYEKCSQSLKDTILNSASGASKTEAIRTLAVVAFYGGAAEEEIEEDTLTFLHEIIDSDGAYADAADSAEVVTAALENYAFLATQLEDMEDSTEPAMDAFIEQLDSSSPGVQIAAGEVIALLYEKSYTDIESDDEDEVELNPDDPDAPPPTQIQRYAPYRRKDLLLAQLESLANISSKRLSKKDRKSLHSSFSDIMQAVENPTLGPRYSTALDQETGQQYGSRLSVKLSKNSSIRVDKWWKLIRLKALRRVLQGGFLEHYQHNKVVLETLPMLPSHH